jgi:hypothetical protein
MSGTLRAVLISLVLLVVGVFAVVLETDNVHSGVRIRKLLKDKDALAERIRRLEMRYNRMVSPDILEAELPAAFRPEEPKTKGDKPRTQRG